MSELQSPSQPDRETIAPLLVSLVANAPVGIAILDRQYRFLQVNHVLAEINGRSIADHLGKPVTDVVPDLIDQQESVFEQIFANGEPILNFEVSGETPKLPGVLRSWNVSYFPLSAEAGQPPIAIGILVLESSDRKAVETALRQSEEQYRQLADAMPMIVWRATPNGSLDYYNQRWFDYTGMTLEQTQGWSWQPILHPDDLQPCMDRWNESVQSGKPYEVEYRFRRSADGAYRWHLGRALPTYHADGTITAWIGTCTDIHEQKQAAQREHFLSEASRELGRSLDYAATLSSVVRFAVPQLADWCAVSVADSTGSLEQIAVAHVDPAKVELAWRLNRRYPDRPDATYGVPQVVRTGASEWVSALSDEVLQAIAHDDEHLEILRGLGITSYMIVPMVARERTLGALTFVAACSDRSYTQADLSFAEDLAQRAAIAVDNARLFQEAQQEVIERTQIEATLQARAAELTHTAQTLRQTASILDKRNQELDQFAYVVSHDLKAPLRAIANLSQWLEEDLEASLTEDTRHQMNLLRGRVHRMENLIDGLLKYSRIGRTSVTSQAIAVGELLQEVIDSIAPPPEFTITVQPAMPTLYTERLRLEQVFANLIGNAIKHHDRPDGKIQIASWDRGDRYEFAVSDDGPGISPQFHSKIFVIFQTLEARDTVESTGIGLSIVQKIVEENGGTVWVDSAPGQGATFRFTWKKST